LSSDVRLFIHVLSLWIIQFIAGRIICVIWPQTNASLYDGE
jgi:hypothetical protein